MQNNKWLVVDLCGTIVKENTTHGFCKSLSLSRPKRVGLFVLMSRLSIRLCNCIASDTHRQAVIKVLKGIPREPLKRQAREYAVKALRENANAFVIDAIKEAHAKGARTLIASASLDVVVEAFGQQLLVRDWVASKLAFEPSGMCLGSLIEDATGRKLSLIKRQLGSRFGEFNVITDNIEDVDLMNAATESIFIK